MSRKKALKILIIFLIIIILVIIYFLLVKKKKNNTIEMVENFTLYQEIIDPNEKSFDKSCPNEEFNKFLLLTEQGSIKSLKLPGGLLTIITPNYYNWSNKKFLSFNTIEPEAFCNAGGTYPLHAYKDKLLWKQGCSTGAMPEPDAPNYQEFMKCIETEETIINFFK
ncbi:hypothetical protein KKH39_01075 [Patescibacteria group bacterium]|nr:hypothetical protein [Patescibacteria group bacterium]